MDANANILNGLIAELEAVEAVEREAEAAEAVARLNKRNEPLEFILTTLGFTGVKASQGQARIGDVVITLRGNSRPLDGEYRLDVRPVLPPEVLEGWYDDDFRSETIAITANQLFPAQTPITPALHALAAAARQVRANFAVAIENYHKAQAKFEADRARKKVIAFQYTPRRSDELEALILDGYNVVSQSMTTAGEDDLRGLIILRWGGK